MRHTPLQRPLRVVTVAARFEALDRDTAESVTVAPLLRASSWLAMSQQREDCTCAISRARRRPGRAEVSSEGSGGGRGRPRVRLRARAARGLLARLN